jgi:alpha-N-acetylglucosaminidase
MQTLIADFGTNHYYAADGTFSHAAAPWASLGEALADPVNGIRKQYREARDASQRERLPAHHIDQLASPPAISSGPLPLPALSSSAPLPAPPNSTIDQHAFAHSKAAYEGMSRTDPDARWVYQTWSWLGGRLGESYYRGWITAPPPGRIILRDLMAEESPLWKAEVMQGYFGAPFIWCMLNDFGGNNGLWGDWASLNENPPAALRAAPNMLGTGLTPEGIFQNAATFELMNENSYRSVAEKDLSEWAERYSYRRYGPGTDAATKAVGAAWRLLQQTAFNVRDSEMVSKDTLTAIPWGKVWDKVYGTDRPSKDPHTPPTPLYNETMFLQAWTLLLTAVEAEPALAKTNTFTHDLVDITRQAIAKYSSKVYYELDLAVGKNDTAGIMKSGAELVDAVEDADTILQTSRGFLLGEWIASARKHGETADEKKLLEWNAKTQVTFWEYPQPQINSSTATFKPSNLQDYACKQWAGLLGTYYKPRWQLFINQTLAQLKSDPRAEFNVSRFHDSMYRWFDDWRETEHGLPAAPTGDPVATSRALHRKYAGRIAGWGTDARRLR